MLKLTDADVKKLELQSDEFDAASDFAKAVKMHSQVAVVDDDYPQVRRVYEGALKNLIASLQRNGRFGTGLTFGALRRANEKRLPQFRDKHGAIAHAVADGSDWSPAEWGNAVAGETGELCNILKKIRRGDMTMEEARNEVAKECADIVTYVDLTALQFNIDLGEATRDKFNEVSARVESDVHL